MNKLSLSLNINTFSLKQGKFQMEKKNIDAKVKKMSMPVILYSSRVLTVKTRLKSIMNIQFGSRISHFAIDNVKR